MTVGEWLAAYGWSGEAAEMLLAASAGMAGWKLDDPAPSFAALPGECVVRPVLSLCEIMHQHRKS